MNDDFLNHDDTRPLSHMVGTESEFAFNNGHQYTTQTSKPQ